MYPEGSEGGASGKPEGRVVGEARWQAAELSLVFGEDAPARRVRRPGDRVLCASATARKLSSSASRRS